MGAGLIVNLGAAGISPTVPAECGRSARCVAAAPDRSECIACPPLAADAEEAESGLPRPATNAARPAHKPAQPNAFWTF